MLLSPSFSIDAFSISHKKLSWVKEFIIGRRALSGSSLYDYQRSNGFFSIAVYFKEIGSLRNTIMMYCLEPFLLASEENL
jgi:hypothetical protein